MNIFPFNTLSVLLSTIIDITPWQWLYMHGRTTLQALAPPQWCKFMWKYQDYVVTSLSKAEGGNLEQQVIWNGHAGQKAMTMTNYIHILYCLHEVGFSSHCGKYGRPCFMNYHPFAVRRALERSSILPRVVQSHDWKRLHAQVHRPDNLRYHRDLCIPYS